MEFHDKEVWFYKYCKTCKYAEQSDTEKPCDICLGIPINTDSHRPVMWEKPDDFV